MSGWHEGALAAFDLETTGANPETARIVSAAVSIWAGTGTVKTSAWLVSPATDIPPEATAVHGITNEMARASGMEPHVAAYEISALLAGSVLRNGIPLVIYNAAYDLTVLDRETRRYGQAPFADLLAGCAGCIIDPFVLDKHLDRYRKGKRTLTATCEHYQVTLDGAHDAGADAVAAMRLAWKIAKAYPAVASLPPGELHELQARARADQSASLADYFRRQGNAEAVDGSWPFKAFTGEAA